MFAMVALTLFYSVAIEVEVCTVDGVSMVGAIAALDAEQLQLVETDESTQSVSMTSVLSISQMPGDAQERFGDAVQVTLTCRSRIMARAIESTDGVVELSTVFGDRLRIDMDSLHSIRFNPPSALDQQWKDLLESELVGDVVVIRRSPDALDYLEGVVRGFTRDHVSFDYEGDVIEVPRHKLEGVLFFGRARPRRGDVKLMASDGSSLHLADLYLDGQAIATETLSGLRIRIPLEHLVRIDFAAGKVLYLGDVTPHHIEVGSAGPATVQSNALRRLLYQPRPNASLFGDALALRMPGDVGIQTFSKGISVHSRTEITYRLDGEYRSLRGIAGMDPRSASRGFVKFEIYSGSNRIFSREIGAADEPVTIDVDVTGTRRLRLLVDYADNWDLSDHLNLCELRLIK